MQLLDIILAAIIIVLVAVAVPNAARDWPGLRWQDRIAVGVFYATLVTAAIRLVVA